MDRAIGLVRGVENGFAGGGQIVLAQRFADIDSPCREKRVGHAPTDDQVIDLADEMLEHVQLGRYLGPADHRGHRMLGRAQRLFQRGELGFHRSPGEGR